MQQSAWSLRAPPVPVSAAFHRTPGFLPCPHQDVLPPSWFSMVLLSASELGLVWVSLKEQAKGTVGWCCLPGPGAAPALPWFRVALQGLQGS